MTRGAAAILRRYGGAGRVDRAYSAVSNKPTGEQERAQTQGGEGGFAERIRVGLWAGPEPERGRVLPAPRAVELTMV